MCAMKHHLTKRGLNLDEVKSLLQKAIRRKDRVFAMQAAAELGDSLKEKHLVTYLLEDHGLAGAETLSEAVKVTRKPREFIELLVDRVKPSRYAACMPVFVMSEEYQLLLQGLDVEADADLVGSKFGLERKEGCLDVGVALTVFRTGWRCMSEKAIMCGMKLLTIAIDHDLQSKVNFTAVPVPVFRKTTRNLCQVALHAVLVEETEVEMKASLMSLIRLAAVPLANLRLVLSVAATRKCLFHGKGLSADVAKTDIAVTAPYTWKWTDVVDDDLKEMPAWAVDKHTKRGKFGVSTVSYYENAPESLRKIPEELVHEFHGMREKRGLEYFLQEGVKLTEEAVPNDVWEATMTMYRKQKVAKTFQMTKAFIEEKLRAEVPHLFCYSSSSGASEVVMKKKQKKQKTLKRVADFAAAACPEPLNKKQKKTEKKEECIVIREAQHDDDELPLLQIPNGVNKTYVRLDPKEHLVVKGPYRRPGKRDIVVARHNMMREVFEDPHTLRATPVRGSFITFPVVKSAQKCHGYVSKKVLYNDYIMGKNVQNYGNVVDPSCLGIKHLHQLSPEAIGKLPATIWLHFAYRYALNIGDSGLFNAICTNDDNEDNLLYGIDLDETRRKPWEPGNGIFSLLFVKDPAKRLKDSILKSLVSNKDFILAKLRVKCTEAMLASYSELVDLELMKSRIVLLRDELKNL